MRCSAQKRSPLMKVKLVQTGKFTHQYVQVVNSFVCLFFN